MDKFRDLLVQEVHRRLLVENIPRIKKCLAELTVEEIWYRPNEHSNSVGNLILHLCGNVRQWLLSGLCGWPDTRHRQAEFDERGPFPTETLVQELDLLASQISDALWTLSAESVLKPIEVQGFRESGVSVLVHVVEHFSYHTGQITFFTKWKKNMDMGYYAGQDLDAVGRQGFD